MADSSVAVLMRAVSPACSIGFIPVAVHFELFSALVELGGQVSSQNVADWTNKERGARAELNVHLAGDALYIMAGLGLLDVIGEDSYKANKVTQHLVAHPTKIQGILHFATEPLMAAAFLYPKLVECNFKYPFKENQAAFQYAYEKQGNSKFANQHLYSTMYDQGRLPSFNYFMEGKFVIPAPMPERVKGLGYDLEAVIKSTPTPIIVDIGGGNGQMLQEIKAAYPELGFDNLILEEFNAAIHPDTNIQALEWDAKSDKPQPIEGATIYSLMHVYHNTPDIEAILLMKKLSAAMGSNSRMLIHEFSKNPNYANMHASMIAMMGGGERTSQQWHQMAEITGLRVTFEEYPDLGEGLVEMMKIIE